MKSVEEDEKASALTRKLFNNIIAAKLKNEREKERLNVRLKGLEKQEERHLSHIQKHLISARQELTNVKTESRGRCDVEVCHERNRQFESLRNVSYLLKQRDNDVDDARNLQTSQHETLKPSGTTNKQNNRKPMSFLDLKRLPPLRVIENKKTISWPNTETMNYNFPLQFPPFSRADKRCSKSLEKKAYMLKSKSPQFATKIKMLLPPVEDVKKNDK